MKPAALSPEYDQNDKKGLLARKLKEKLGYGGDSHLYMDPESMKGSMRVAEGEEIRGMMLTDLQTRNGQSTMFSKGFNNAETAA
jgi:hypothetical protein